MSRFRPAIRLNAARFLSGQAAIVMAALLWLCLVPAANAQAPAATQPSAAAAGNSTLESSPIRERNGASPLLVRKAPASDSSSGFSVTRVLFALGVVLGLIFLARWAGRRFFHLPTAGGANGAIQVLTRCMLSPRQQLMLVQVGRRIILVSNTGAQMNPLCEISDPDEMATVLSQIQQKKSSDSLADSFRSFFGQAGSQFKVDDVHENSLPVGIESQDATDPTLATTREELGGLLEKVRTVSRHFKRA